MDDHIKQALDKGCPARAQFKLRAELVTLDDLAASTLLASGQHLANRFAIQRDYGGDDTHVSVLITTDASLAERTKNTLPVEESDLRA